MNDVDGKSDNGKKKRRKRLAPVDRDAQIVREAIRFFAEVGIDGQTRELAQRLGITQPLLYRYFPTKRHLIERVYVELFEKSWKPGWKQLLLDRTVPLRQRLVEFYKDYTGVIFTYEWMRIYMYSGLAGAALNRKYIARLENDILKTIFREIQTEHKDHKRASSFSDVELELVWNLHGGIFYYGVRKYIYQIDVPEDLATVIELSVDMMLADARLS